MRVEVRARPRMVKEQFRESDIASAISHVQFSPFSSNDITKQATIQILDRNLYTQDASHKPVPNGVLDHRLVRSIEPLGLCGDQLV